MSDFVTNAALSVPCPECDAPAGERCAGNLALIGAAHACRRDAWTASVMRFSAPRQPAQDVDRALDPWRLIDLAERARITALAASEAGRASADAKEAHDRAWHAARAAESEAHEAQCALLAYVRGEVE